jgi:hypothetical protein
MNVVQINLEANMGVNVNIHPHYGWMIFFIHLMYGWKKLIAFSTFLINKISIRSMDVCFILSLNYYG